MPKGKPPRTERKWRHHGFVLYEDPHRDAIKHAIYPYMMAALARLKLKKEDLQYVYGGSREVRTLLKFIRAVLHVELMRIPNGREIEAICVRMFGEKSWHKSSVHSRERARARIARIIAGYLDIRASKLRVRKSTVKHQLIRPEDFFDKVKPLRHKYSEKKK